MRLPRRARICSSGSCRRSRDMPSDNRISPLTCACDGSRRMMASDVTDLPDPDSPTRPRTSPGARLKLRSRTATRSRGAAPFALTVRAGNSTVRLRTSRRAGTEFIVAGAQRTASGVHFLHGLAQMLHRPRDLFGRNHRGRGNQQMIAGDAV